jgi:hypothetical protein
VKLLGDLQFSDTKAELSALMKGAALSTTRESGSEDQLSAQAVNAAVQILVTNSASNPPGSEKLLAALERVKLVLESVKVNRSTVAQMAARFADAYIAHFPQEASDVLLCGAATPEEETSAEAVLVAKEEQLQRAKENLVCGTESLTEIFVIAAGVRERANVLSKTLHEDVCAAIAEITPGIAPSQCEAMVAAHLCAVSSAPSTETSQLVSGLQDIVDELEGLVMFIEEKWVQDKISGLVRGWAAAKLAITMSNVRLPDLSFLSYIHSCLPNIPLIACVPNRTALSTRSSCACRPCARRSGSWCAPTPRCASTCRRWTSSRRRASKTAARP